MAIADELQTRAEGKCELCAAGSAEEIYAVLHSPQEAAEAHILLCGTCRAQVEPEAVLDVHHWRCLNDSMWSEVSAVQVVAWRMLQRLSTEDWARDLTEMLYMDDEVLSWARLGVPAAAEDDDDVVRHVDSNGVQLIVGDAVTLIKDLNVKGTSFVAKRGTVVRGIRLVANNAAQIEGRVNGQQIVILTEFVKK